MISSLLFATALLASNALPEQRVPARAIERAAREGVAARLSEIGSKAQLRVSARIDDQMVAAGTLGIELGELSGRLPRPRVGVPVRLLVDGRLARSITVWLEMQDVRTVMTYAADYDARQPASGMQTRMAEVDMTCCSGEPVVAAVELEGLRSTRALRAGQPVLRGEFEPLPEVIAGQRVEVELDDGAVRLRSSGIALADGRTGERLAVRLAHAREAVPARVVAEAKVVIDE